MGKRDEYRSPDELRKAAYHEAGHAVMAYLLHRAVKLVTIEPDSEEGSAGHIAFGRLPAISPEWENDARTYNECKRIIQIALAGDAAVCRWKRIQHLPRGGLGGASDWHDAVSAASCFYPRRRVLEAFMQFCWVNTREYFDAPKNWELVKALVAVLLKERTIKWQRARGIIWAAEESLFLSTLSPKRRGEHIQWALGFSSKARRAAWERWGRYTGTGSDRDK